MVGYTIIDFETTGLFADMGDRITEIGAIKLNDKLVCGVFSTLVNPERNIPSESTRLTGITNEMVANSPTIDKVLPMFVDFAGDDILVMHNAKFDGSFLRYEMKHLGIERNFNYYCTLLASRKEIKSSNFKLATLKNVLNLKTLGTMHRALSDTFVTAQLFLKLEKKFGIDTLANLEKEVLRMLSEMESDDIYVIDKVKLLK